MGIKIELADNRFDGKQPALSDRSYASSIDTVSDLFALVKKYDKELKPNAAKPIPHFLFLHRKCIYS